MNLYRWTLPYTSLKGLVGWRPFKLLWLLLSKVGLRLDGSKRCARKCYFYYQKLDSDWIAQYYHCKEVNNKWNMIIRMEIFLALLNLDQDQRANSQLFKWWWEVASKLSRPNPYGYYQCGICMVEFHIQFDRRISTPPKLAWSFEAGSWMLTDLILRNLQWKYWLKKGVSFPNILCNWESSNVVGIGVRCENWKYPSWDCLLLLGRNMNVDVFLITSINNLLIDFKSFHNQ
jgi:hypothetical protein